MDEKKNVLDKFLKLLQKNKFEVKNNDELKYELNNILAMDFNIKHHDISTKHFEALYPQFNEKVHKLLSRCAKEQKYDFRKNTNFSIRKEKILIEFV